MDKKNRLKLIKPYISSMLSSASNKPLVLIRKKENDEYIVVNPCLVDHEHQTAMELDASTFFGSSWRTLASQLEHFLQTSEMQMKRIEIQDESNGTTAVQVQRIQSNLYEEVFILTFQKESENCINVQCSNWEEKYKCVLDYHIDPIITIDQTGIILYANPAVYQSFGFCAEEMKGLPLDRFIEDRMYARLRWFIQHVFQGESVQLMDVPFVHKKGYFSQVHLQAIPIQVNQEIQEVHFILKDSSDPIRHHQTLLFLSYHDQLTGLWNRRALKEQFQQVVQAVKESKQRLALIHVDLDRFKTINDSLGRDVADELLVKVADRMKLICSNDCKLYRNGGDEFLIVMQHKDTESVEQFAQKILSDFSKPFYYQHQEYFLSASIGISVFPEDGETLEELMQKCEDALLFVKHSGRSHYRFYQKKMKASFPNAALMEAHLRRAIEFDELELHYQPQVNLMNGKIDSFEALLRWNNRKFGFVSPAHFIPIAEDAGLIHMIGEWVLERVCKQLREWQEKGFKETRIAINISPEQFRKGNLVQRIKSIIEMYQIHPRCLEVEITESALMNIQDTLVTLNILKKLGIRISIDDFGTGYSALSYLKFYPIDIIKIDRSFIKDIETDEKNKAIAKTIINLAHNLGMEVIAEGVEKDLQAAFLAEAQCNKAQGFLYSKALPPDEVVQKYFKHQCE